MRKRLRLARKRRSYKTAPLGVGTGQDDRENCIPRLIVEQWDVSASMSVLQWSRFETFYGSASSTLLTAVISIYGSPLGTGRSTSYR